MASRTSRRTGKISQGKIIYEATRPKPCSICGCPIEVGQHFIRGNPDPGQPLISKAICMKCRPVETEQPIMEAA